MTDPTPRGIDSIHNILRSAGLDAVCVSFLARGGMSEAWRAETSIGTVVMRLGAPLADEVPRFTADAAVRERLHRMGERVAKPIAHGILPEVEGKLPWIVDHSASGEPAAARQLPDAACEELGRILTRLHALPFGGYGLLQNRDDVLVGEALDPVSGLLTRLVDPWPYGTKTVAHPIASVAPDIIEMLPTRVSAIHELVERGPHAVSHTDLHAGQILVEGTHLAALLDFGDAAIMPHAWDLASFAMFHGWERLPRLLAGYSQSQANRHRLQWEAQLLAVPLALHHVSRAQSLGQPVRLPRALRLLRGALERMHGGIQPV